MEEYEDNESGRIYDRDNDNGRIHLDIWYRPTSVKSIKYLNTLARFNNLQLYMKCLQNNILLKLNSEILHSKL